MTSTSLPSTLVKCLYLFFDLADLEKTTENKSDVAFSRIERRMLLQKMFIQVSDIFLQVFCAFVPNWNYKIVQVLMRLCAYVPAVEELARKDDLNLLFSAVTTACPKANVMWRKTAADILLTISRKSLSLPVISYLHSECRKKLSFSLFALCSKLLSVLQTRVASISASAT